MLEFLTLKPDAFGLDVSDLSLKIIKLEKKRGGLGLACFGEHKLRKGIIRKGKIKDENALADNIKKALSKVKGKKIKTKYVIASLPEEKAFLQVIQMPRLSALDLKSAVIYEAENYIPLPIEQVYLDSQVVPPLHNGVEKLSVLIAALPKITVDPYVSCFRKAGLLPIALEIESQAIARALVKNEVSPIPLFLIDFGITRTSFIVFSGYSLRFTSYIPVSSQSFTEAISRVLKVDIKKAEEMKIKYGIKSRETKKGKEIFDAITPPLTDLIEQIKKSLSFYQTHITHEHLPPDGKKAKKILLCGGGANLKGLVEFLSSELKAPVSLGNPWVNILPKPLKEVPELPYKESLRYTTALGLALRGVRENYD